MLFRTATVAAAWLIATGACAIAPVTSGTRGVQIALVGPVGQSFVADDTRLNSFGFQFAVANAGIVAMPLSFELRAGAGLGGVLITSTVANPTISSGRTPTWYDFDLAGTTLVIGQSYTALVSTGAARLALIFGPNLSTNGIPVTGDAYAGGTLVSASPVDTAAGSAGYCATSGACDANFRVNALAAVPEPATWLSMTAGMMLTGVAMRRRRVLASSV